MANKIDNAATEAKRYNTEISRIICQAQKLMKLRTKCGDPVRVSWHNRNWQDLREIADALENFEARANRTGEYANENIAAPWYQNRAL